MSTSLAPYNLQPGVIPADVHAVTAPLGDADTSIATTEFVENTMEASTVYFDNYFTGLGTLGSPISLRPLYFSFLFSGTGTIGDPITIVRKDPEDFVVNDVDSFMLDGESSKTLTDFIGYNLLFFRGGIVQSTVNTELSYYTWNKATGAFTCSPAMSTDETIKLMPL